VVDPKRTSVEAQRDDPGSTLTFVRDLLTIRRVLGAEIELMDAPQGVLSYRRGDHAVAVNTTSEERRTPLSEDVVLETQPGALRGGALAPHSGAITMGLQGSQKG
jgi:hypothetical protein